MPKLWEALVTMLILVGALALGIVKYETDPHVPMFIGVMGAALMALYLGYKWEAIEKSMMDGIYNADRRYPLKRRKARRTLPRL